MTSLTLHAHGKAQPDVVWERYADPSAWPQWAPQINKVHASAPRIAPGVTGTVDGPVGVSIKFTIDEVDEAARRWSWTVRVGPAKVRLEHGVQPHEDGTQTWLTFNGPMPLVLTYAPIARFALGRVVAP